MHDVTLIDAYGRGAWLAAELSSTYNVQVVDCTESMGSWSSEDKEGPFALFSSGDLSVAGKEHLLTPSLVEPCPRGICLRVNGSPFEFHGPFYSVQKENWNLPESLFDDLKNGSVRKESGWEAGDQVRALAHSYSATRFLESFRAADFSQPTPFSEPCSIRRAGPGDSLMMLDKWRELGVSVYSESKLVDLSIQERSCGGVEIRSKEFAGFLKSSKTVCFLSTEELKWLSPSVFEQLQLAEIPSVWSWVRFRFKMEDHPTLAGLPIHWLNVEKIDLPFSHENFLIVNATYNHQLWDCWMRIPSSDRFDRGFLTEMAAHLTRFWRKMLPGVEGEVHEWPQEYNYQDLSPAPYVLFEETQKEPRCRFRNWYMLGPETYRNHDRVAQMSQLKESSRRVVSEMQSPRGDNG